MTDAIKNELNFSLLLGKDSSSVLLFFEKKLFKIAVLMHIVQKGQ